MTREETIHALSEAMMGLNSAQVDLGPLKRHADPAMAMIAQHADRSIAAVWCLLYDQRARIEGEPRHVEVAP